MEMKQQDYVFLHVLQAILQMIKQEHVFINVHQIMVPMAHLATIQQEYAKRYAQSLMHMQILKQSIDIVSLNALKVLVNLLQIHPLKIA